MVLVRIKILIVSFCVVVVSIGVLSLMPPRSNIELGDHDKINHFIAYLVLSFNWSLINMKGTLFWKGLCACIAYGLLLEFLQGFVPGRDPSWADALANTGGVLIGLVLFFIFKRISK
ncbi:MAG: VanZ family protein [Crocinitomicaceae bacterium]|jgi:VanZ family protein|tara:strand:- start:4243 stop:4593 length:351 start_codon:yes stop_codon:yes gene_type:complete